MDDRQQRENRRVDSHDSKRFHIQGVVVSRLSVQPRLRPLDYEFCRMLCVAHDDEE